MTLRSMQPSEHHAGPRRLRMTGWPSPSMATAGFSVVVGRHSLPEILPEFCFAPGTRLEQLVPIDLHGSQAVLARVPKDSTGVSLSACGRHSQANARIEVGS